MAGGKGHAYFGALSGAVASVWAQPAGTSGALVAAELMGGMVGGKFGARLPDIFEPATSSHHRKFFHAVVPAGITIQKGVMGVLELRNRLRQRAQALVRALADETDPSKRAESWLWAMWFSFLAGIVVGAPAGYLSHLALDALTPRGLPLIC